VGRADFDAAPGSVAAEFALRATTENTEKKSKA